MQEVAEAAVGGEDAAALAGLGKGVCVVMGFDCRTELVLALGRDEAEFEEPVVEALGRDAEAVLEAQKQTEIHSSGRTPVWPTLLRTTSSGIRKDAAKSRAALWALAS